MNVEIGDLKRVLAGEALALDDFIDIASDTSENFVPITKQTVTYIVAGVFFNENEEVLMMQEAKKSCYKTWYLPAGRLEPNETLEEGVVREVLEETGLQCKPTTLFSVQLLQGRWFRFAMTGIITGGKLKSPAEADRESLQAQWFPVEAVKNRDIPIRAKDAFKLIDDALVHRRSQTRHRDLLPVIVPHQKLLLRLTLVYYSAERNEVMLLVGTKPRNHLPVKLIKETDLCVEVAVFAICMQVFGRTSISPHIYGVLSVEHSGRPAAINDGVCITVLVSLDSAIQPKIVAKDSFAWSPVSDDDLKKEVLERCVIGRAVKVVEPF